MAQFNAVSGFKASVNGLHFTNRFPQGTPDIVVNVPPFGNITIGDAYNGLCGGMVFTVRDVFQANIAPIPDTTTPPGQSPLFNYIVKRLFDSFNIPDSVLKYIDWMGSPDHDTGFWFFGNWVVIGRGVAWRTIMDEWPIIQATIDGQMLAPLALVTVSSYNPADLGKNHQVLAYAYEVDDADQLTLHVYDPNTFPPDADGVRLKLSLTDPTHTTHIDHNVDITEPIRGFFHVPYTFADPLSLEPVPPPNSNALFVSQPSSLGPLVPGQRVRVQVVMQNLGTTMWTASGANPFRLGSQNPEDNTTWGMARVDVQGSIAPGAQATFDFDVTAPTAPGIHNFQWRMVQEMVNWFGDFTPSIPVFVQPVIPPLTSDALFVSQRPPVGPLVPGQSVRVQVVLLNKGGTTWTASGANLFRLGSQNPQDNTTWGMARVDVQGSIAPGAQATFDFDVTAPAAPGTYNFQWRMMQEVGNWFGDFTPSIPVVVQPALPTLNVSVQPYPVPVKKLVSVTVSAFDAVTGALISGSVLLDGMPVGTTGTAFLMIIPMEPFYDPELKRWIQVPAPPIGTVTAPGYATAYIDFGR